MKYIWLVAVREFAENAKTKGFWLGLILLPIMLLIGIRVQAMLKKAIPVRHFIVVDQSDDYGKPIARALRRDLGKQRLEALTSWSSKHAVEGKPVDLDRIPASIEQLKKQLGANPQLLDACSTDAGWELLKQSTRKQIASDAPPIEEPTARFVRVPLPDEVTPDDDPDAIAKALKPYLLQQKQLTVDGEPVDLFAAVIIPKDVRGRTLEDVALAAKKGTELPTVQYWSINLADTDLPGLMQRAIDEEYQRRAYVDKGVNIAAVKKIQDASLPLAKKNPKKREGREDVSMADLIRQWAPIGFVYLLWVAIFTVSQMLLNNTIEEKSNRIIEVLLSSVTARELMWGKLFGIAAVGLTMVAAWIVSFFAILVSHKSQETQMINQVLEVLQTSNLIPYFVVYFLFGFLFYAGIFLSIGSICNTLKEAQNFMGPIMMVMMVPLVTMFFIPKDPNGTLATVLSWIPLYTPFVMMNRTAADPPLFDQVGTIVLMIVSTAVMLWLSAKIFRTGILRSGQPPRLVEVFRWLKSS